MILLLARSLTAALLMAAAPDGGALEASPDTGAFVEGTGFQLSAPPVEDPIAEEDAQAEEDGAAAPDDASAAEKVDDEMEELRATEAAVIEEGAKRAAEIFKAMRRASPASPLHERMQDVLGVGRALPIVPDEAEMEMAALESIGAFDIEKAKKMYDIPVEMQPLVAEYIRFFQGPARKHFVKWLGRSSRWMPMMKKALRESGLPEDTVYLSMIESGFATAATSKAKAVGLWQFIEPTGRRFGLKVDFWRDDRRDPVKSTYAAAGFLKELYTDYGDWRLAWAGYNAGGGTVRRAILKSGSTDFWKQSEGRSAYRQETRHYVPKLMAAALISKNLKAFGFSESEFTPEEPLAYEDVEVPEATDLELVARAAGVSVEVVKELNPALRRWCTPPSSRADDLYRVHLPVGTAARFAEEFPQIAPKERMHFAVHVVGKGDTLSKIAAKYGSAGEAIMRMNGLKDSRRLKVRSELVVPVPRGGGSGAREQLAQAARRQGFRAAPSDQEVPAAEPPKKKGRTGALAGSQRTVREGSRTKVLYAVAEGDSLWTISRKFGVKLAQLREWNGFGGGAVKLQIGQEIAVYPEEKSAARAEKAERAEKRPAPAKQAAPAGRGSAVHVVAEGDTLWSVSQKYKVSVDELKRMNRISNNRLKVGQPLTIPVP